MLHTPLKLLATVVLTVGTVTSAAWARDGVRITIPAHSQLTPVQRLNREGVEAVKKRDYAKAESLFYKAYLYDPADPFTLNNLGFISELQGQLDRAHKFYELASEQGSNADIDVSNVKTLEGRPMKIAFESLQDSPMRVNRINVNAMRLLSEGRGFDAVSLLKQALALDPHNPFTLNNLGVAEEAIGDYQSALRYYGEVSTSRSKETVMVTPDQSWSGKSVSEMAASNAERLEREMQKAGPHESEAAMFNMRGVLAVNQNDWKRNVRKVAGNLRKSGRGKTGKRNHWILGRRKTREDQVVPHHVRLQFANRVEKTHRSRQAAKLPATDNIESRQFWLLIRLERIAVPIRRKIVVGELVSQDRKFNTGISLQLSRNVKRVLVELAPTGRKSRNQTNLHRGPPSKYTYLQIGPQHCALASGKLDETFLLHSR